MKKLLLTAAASLVLAAGTVSAAPTITDLTGGLKTFADDVPKSLPFAAGSGIDWSTAYIGNLINTDFPFVHFGLGGSVGLTTIPGDAVKPLVTSMGQSFGMASVPLPFVNINGRIGGLVLPFDVGFKVGFLPDEISTYDGYKITYNTFGVDVRYDLVKSNLVLPDVMVGFGISGMSAALTKSYGSGLTYDDLSGNKLIVGAPKMTIDLSSMEYEAKAQISKGLVFITPYLGLGVGYGTGKAKAGVNSAINTTGPGGLAYWQNTYGLDVTSTGFSKSNNAGVFGSRIYGGTSFDLLALKVDVQGEYSILDHAYGGSVGARLQF
jgi:opacity protein-like surface antigen